WLAADLDQTSPAVHVDALVLGRSYALVWGDTVTGESARQVTVATDPATGQVTAALKRWSTEATTEAALFEPATVTRYRADVTGATSGGFRAVATMGSPLWEGPMWPCSNSGRLLGVPRREMQAVLSLTDALVKLSADMLASSEY